jgi:diaminopimelate epimerase
MALDVAFAKMNGIGNLILVADMRGRADSISPQAAVALNADPATRFDQIMAIHDPRLDGTDNYIDILNSDGSRAEACGNGTRCVVQALSAETGKPGFTFQTPGGIVNAEERADGMISVDMGKPRFRWDEIPLAEEFHDTTGIELQIGPIDAPVLHTPSVANIGNPHAVFWVTDDVWTYDLERFGPLLENHPIFPEKANISIANVIGRDHIVMRTWERGAGITEACGSAACAVLVCAARMGRSDRKARITLPGGDLTVEWRDDDHIIMTGPAEWEFSGMLDPVSGEWRRDTANPSREAM